MSDDVVIRVEDLGKQYRIGRELRYRTLRETLNDWAAAPFRWLRRGGPAPTPETIWALRHVNLEVKRGEVVGIIGRNGAGKSTLLKILARITEPTEGRVELVGRVGSLLEVGTGFHPELTGRENIFLNGALLGMTRREIQRKFDEIVAFAEIDRFLDTPVKHYSSGMYMRLAFAVAAHLEPEILIVDEVLAVGDAAFQKKCLGKMGAVAREGRTVLFVSHNMAAVTNLCPHGVCLDQGEVICTGPIRQVIDAYFSRQDTQAGNQPAARRPGSGEVRFDRVWPDRESYRPDEEKRVRFRLHARSTDVKSMYLSALVASADGAVVAHCDSRLVGLETAPPASGEGHLSLRLPWLKPGEYWVDLYICAHGLGILDHFERACSLKVLPLLPYPASASPDAIAGAPILADFAWQLLPGNAV